MSHHWRPWPPPPSQEDPPPPPPPPPPTRPSASAWLVSSSAADHATGHSTESNASPPPHQLHSKLFWPGLMRARDIRTVNNRLKSSSRRETGRLPRATAAKTL